MKGFSLFSVVTKIYVGVLVERVRGMTEKLTGEEQGAFRSSIGCVNKIFVLR